MHASVVTRTHVRPLSSAGRGAVQGTDAFTGDQLLRDLHQSARVPSRLHRRAVPPARPTRHGMQQYPWARKAKRSGLGCRWGSHGTTRYPRAADTAQTCAVRRYTYSIRAPLLRDAGTQRHFASE